MLETISGRTNSGIFRPRVLLTGASGVVGQALLKRLINADITCLAHRATIDNANCGTVFGDISKPDLGLSAAEPCGPARPAGCRHQLRCRHRLPQGGRELWRRRMSPGRPTLRHSRAAANATLYHVSTAFRDAQAMGERGAQAVLVRRIEAVRRGRQSARAGQRHVILRPSIVIGDSTHWAGGEIPRVCISVAGAIASDLVPMIPFNGLWALDFVPERLRRRRHCHRRRTAGDRGRILVDGRRQGAAAGAGRGDLPAQRQELRCADQSAAVRPAGIVRSADRPGLPGSAAQAHPDHPCCGCSSSSPSTWPPAGNCPAAQQN